MCVQNLKFYEADLRDWFGFSYLKTHQFPFEFELFD